MDSLPTLLPPLAEPKAPKPPPAPDAAEIAAAAEDEFNDHAIRISQYREMNGWINGDTIGHFARDTEAIEAGEAETFPLEDLTSEHKGIVDFHAGMDVTVDLVARDPNDTDEAQALEDYCALVHDQWRETHLAEGSGVLDRTLPDYAARYAMLATYVAIDPSNADTGMYLRTVSGTRVYPVFEGAKGLTKLYLIYDARPDQIIGAHEDLLDPNEPVRNAVEDLTGGDNARTSSNVVEYYDAHHGVVMVEDTIVKQWEHGYGVCPWVVTPFAFGGDPNDLAPNKFMPLDRESMLRGSVVGNDRSVDLARAYQPFLYRRIRAHAAEEAMAGRMFTLMRRLTSSKPPVVVKQSILGQQSGDPEVDAEEGKVTLLTEQDALDAFPLGLGPDISNPLLALMAQNRQLGMASGLALGAQNPASQMSGTALELGRQGGFDKWSDVTTGLQAHYAAVFRRCLDLVAVHGEGLGLDGSYGKLLVPRRAPSATTGLGAMHEITADLVQRTSVRVKVSLGRFNPISLSQTGNGIAIWRSQNLMSKDTAIRIGGYTNDIPGELERIDDDQLNDVPEVKQAKTLDRIARKVQRAEAENDTVTVREELIAGHFIASAMQLQFEQKLQQLGMGPAAPDPNDPMAQQAQPPPQAPQGLPGVPTPPPPPPEPDIQGQGQSMPNFGIQPGQQGGRPDMSGGGGANG